jgi:hypothetical protein
LTYRLLRDDGAVVYLNGVEQGRSNLPASGPILANTLASDSVGGDDEERYETWNAPPDALREGNNLVAVAVHQHSANSSDLSFDLELLAYGAAREEAPPLTWRREDGALEVEWMDPEERWELYASDSLAMGRETAWTWVGAATLSDDGVRVVTVSPGGAARFFRLQRGPD